MIQDLSVLAMLGWYSLADLKDKNLKTAWMKWFLIESIAGGILLWKSSPVELLVSTLPGVLFLVLGLTTKGGIGAGDSILVLILGLFLGIHRTFLLLFYAVTGSGLTALLLIVVRRVNKRYELPFVPFLLIGYVLVLAGECIE